MMNHQISPVENEVSVIDFGSQYTQLIVRRVRELGFLAHLYQPEELPLLNKPGAIILSGGPKSTHDEDAIDIDFAALQGYGVPVLGVCYGMQLLNLKFGGSVSRSEHREYGPAQLVPKGDSPLYQGVKDSQVWMSHSDTVENLSETTQVIATNKDGIPVSLSWGHDFYGIQFHPEVTHSHQGTLILKNFLNLAPELKPFKINDFKEELLEKIRKDVGGREVVCGVSGGVDSTVLAVLLKEAGVNMRAIFVDHGLLRKNESAEVQSYFKKIGINLQVLEVSELFLGKLAGVSDPEVKRKIIGNLFLDVFWDAVGGEVELLAQGTLYPDVIESASNKNSKASTIKTHHNRISRVLELQEQGKVLEPLDQLFKDEVRELGMLLGIDADIVNRHPFPGPGLAVRCPGAITPEKLHSIREADAIFIGKLKEHGWYDKVWQACVTLIDSKTVGVKGDERSYENPVSLRAVISEDAMTADWVELPYELIREVSNLILNKVPGVNRVLYDVSTKPPASIEWE